MDLDKLEKRFKQAELYMDNPDVTIEDKERALPKFRELAREYSMKVYIPYTNTKTKAGEGR